MKWLMAVFTAAFLFLTSKSNGELDRPLKFEFADSEGKPESCDVLLAYGRELSSKFPKLEDAAVYALIELPSDEVIIAKIELGKDDVVVVGEREFSQLSYMGIFMSDNCAAAVVLDPKNPSQETKLRLFVTPPIDPESIKILKEAERGAVRNDDRVSAAEMRWLTGEWQEASRHLELAGRDFSKKNDRVRQITSKRLEQVARGKLKK